jgi:hypothetical protein
MILLNELDFGLVHILQLSLETIELHLTYPFHFNEFILENLVFGPEQVNAVFQVLFKLLLLN